MPPGGKWRGLWALWRLLRLEGCGVRLYIRCLGECGTTYLVSTGGNRLPMPNVWSVDADGLPGRCRTCGGCVAVVETETCLRLKDERGEDAPE